MSERRPYSQRMSAFMQCAEVRECLALGQIPDENHPHLRNCEHCATLVAQAAAKRELGGISLDDVLSNVQTQIRNERGPIAWLRSRPTAWRGAIGLFAGTAIVIAAVIATARMDPAEIGRVHSGAILVYTFAALVVASELLRPMHKTLRNSVSNLLSLAALLLPIAGAVLLAGHHDGPPIRARPGCMLIGFSVAVPVFYAFRALDRGGFSDLRTRVLAIATAGLAANVALALCCPSTSTLHLLKWHAPIGLMLLGSSIVLRRIGIAR